MSVPAATTALIERTSPAQLQDGLADLHDVARVDLDGRGDAVVVHEGAVRGAQVLEEPRPVARRELRVVLARLRVVEPHLTGLGSARSRGARRAGQRGGF